MLRHTKQALETHIEENKEIYRFLKEIEDTEKRYEEELDREFEFNLHRQKEYQESFPVVSGDEQLTLELYWFDSWLLKKKRL